MPRPLAALVLVTLFLHAHAEATTLSWKAAVSGSAVSGSNWNPAQVPTSTDDLVFNLAGAYTVTWNGSDASGVRMAPGVYFLKSKVGSDQTVSRLIYVSR